MAIATGVAKQLRYKKESAWGTLPGASGAQMLRRVQSNLSLRKETYKSEEIRTDYQTSDMRHGVRSAGGDIGGEVSPGTYKDFIAAALRQAWQTAPTTGALTNVTASATAPHFERAAGSFFTNGFKVGDVVRWSGWATTGVPNNARNFLILVLTATQMSGVFLDSTAVGAKASGDSVTCVLQGKKTWVPESAHTDESFAFEHWHSDITQSEVFTGCKISSMAIDLPPTGISKISMDIMGKDMVADTAAYFTSPTAETTTGVVAAVNGKLYVGGTAVALITGLSISINGNMSADPVVGSNTYPDIFEGSVDVDGQMTVFFQDGTMRDLWDDETETSVIAVFTTSNQATADFLVFVMPRIKAGGADKDDGQKGLVMTMPYTALFNGAGGSGTTSEKTTISIQDSTVS